MGQISFSASPFVSFLALFLSLILMSSFGLHAIQIQHEHFDVVGTHGGHTHAGDHTEFTLDALDVSMHLSDKKLLVMLVVGIALHTVFFTLKDRALQLLYGALRGTQRIFHHHIKHLHIRDYLHLYLRKGIFHTKVY